MRSVLALLANWQDHPQRRDAEDLVLHVIRRDRLWLRMQKDSLIQQTLTTDELSLINAHLQRLAESEPLAYILGSQEFWSLQLKVTVDTLIPRPDTERLVELALEKMTTEQGRALDLGTGSGAIALALKHSRPAWEITAVDQSPDALAVAHCNGAELGLTIHWRQGNWFEALRPVSESGFGSKCYLDSESFRAEFPRFDVIVSNPPYIDEKDEHLPDLTHEPLSALVAADHGLADLHRIIAEAPDWLAIGGWLLLEHGHDQGAAVRSLLSQCGYAAIETLQDYGGNDRVSRGRYDDNHARV